MVKISYKDKIKCKKITSFFEEEDEKIIICDCGDHTTNKDGVCDNCKLFEED